jgi:hypothetical protein
VRGGPAERVTEAQSYRMSLVGWTRNGEASYWRGWSHSSPKPRWQLIVRGKSDRRATLWGLPRIRPLTKTTTNSTVMSQTMPRPRPCLSLIVEFGSEPDWLLCGKRGEKRTFFGRPGLAGSGLSIPENLRRQCGRPFLFDGSIRSKFLRKLSSRITIEINVCPGLTEVEDRD